MNNANHIVLKSEHVREALRRLDTLAQDAVLFVVDDNKQLIGSITDGDIRRGLINGLELESPIEKFANASPKYIKQNTYSPQELDNYRNKKYKIVPIVDERGRIVDLINFRLQYSTLPVHAVIMAGGKGMRLRPLTLDTPKPLLKVGGKPIVEYNIDRLRSFGIHHLVISVKYLGQQIIDYFGDGADKKMNISYVEEDQPLGTLGAVTLIPEFKEDYILVMNSDLLTNINFEDMFNAFMQADADIIMATTPYEVNIPYGVVEMTGDEVSALVEKPTYTYYSNAGIYIVKREHFNLIPKDQKYNATDLIDSLLSQNKRVLNYPIRGYWRDIGKPSDFEQAQKDVVQIKF